MRFHCNDTFHGNECEKGYQLVNEMKKGIVLILVMVAMLMYAACPAAADTQDVLEQKKSDAETYLRELKGQLTGLTEEYDDLQVQYEDTRYQLSQLEKQLEEASSSEARQREGMKTRIRYMYENSADMAGFTALLGSGNFMDFLTTANNMSELSRYDRQMLEQYQDICSLIAETQEQVRSEQESVAGLKQNCAEKQKELQALIEETSADVERYSEEIRLEKNREAEAALLELQAQAEVAAMLAETPVFTDNTAQTAYLAADTSQMTYTEEAVAQTAALTDETAYTDAGQSVTVSETAVAPAEAEEPAKTGGYSEGFVPDTSWGGSVLTAMAGVNEGPTGRETYYNMEMSGVVDIMRGMGNGDDYWVRDDGVKMLGDYVMVAANLDKYPRGSVVDSSLGKAIVCDTGGFAAYNEDQLDIATAW